MLILSRKNGQKIIINDNIEITIVESKNDNCKISIEAPREIKIYREEVYKQIKSSNQKSTSSLSDLGQIAGLMPKADEATAKKKTVIIKKKPE